MALFNSVRGGLPRSGVQFRTKLISHNLEKSISTVHSFHYFSSDTTASTCNNSGDALKERRREIFRAALKHVPECGWTDDALAQGVLDAGYPPASIGLASTNGGAGDLVSFHMDECAGKLEKQLQQTEMEETNYAEKLEFAIRTRLEMNIPLIRAKRWHEGMATGTLQGPTTAQQLDTICHVVQTFVNSHNSGNGSVLERAAIGSIYLATELHMIMDEDLSTFVSTWQFLNQRVSEFNSMSLPSSTPEIHTAANAVISSLGGATISLLQPAIKVGVGSVASSVVPAFMNLMQPPSFQSKKTETDITQGVNARDYTVQTQSSQVNLDFLPPFDVEQAREPKA